MKILKEGPIKKVITKKDHPLRKMIREEIKKVLNEGATDIGRTFKGTEQQLRKAFVKWQKEDRQYFGNNPYGANWSNCPGLRIASTWEKPKNEKEAWKIVEQQAKKWEPAIAVEYDKNKWVVGAVVPE